MQHNKPKSFTPSAASRELESTFPAFVANSASDDQKLFNTQLPDDNDMIAEQDKEYDAEEELELEQEQEQ